MRKRSGVIVWTPQLYKLKVLIEFKQLCGRATARAAPCTCPRINKQVTFGVLRNSFGLADGMTRTNEGEMLLGNVQLRNGFFQCKLFFSSGLCFRAISELRLHAHHA